ncbi:MAG: hypothetical protein KatS3mg097_057 [Candidatus Parcubacteria bacterium]|nr:MAG: hypothetical protein KatS3mg097_057 [Candidatus Parcubacteria bacterium]
MFYQSNKELVESLKERKVLKTPEIIKAFLRIDRKDFVPQEFLNEAYNDYPLPIGREQTISQPYTVAFMLELLEPKQEQKILDVGFGSGWTTCLLAEITRTNTNYNSNREPTRIEDDKVRTSSRDGSQEFASGKVYAIEIAPEVFEFGKRNIEKYNFLKKGIVEIFLGDGSKGLPEKAPFDRILISAAAKKIPQSLLDQLNDNGVLVIPADNGIYKIKKSGDKINKEFYFGFSFVPLVGD